MLNGELEAVLQLDKEAKLAPQRYGALLQRIPQFEEHLGVHFAGQGRYKYNPRKVRKCGNGTGRQRFNPLDIVGYFNCGDLDHMLKDCRKPFNASNAGAKKLEHYNRKDSGNHTVHLVLADLFKQLDGLSCDNDARDDDQPERDDLEIFQAA